MLFINKSYLSRPYPLNLMSVLLDKLVRERDLPQDFEQSLQATLNCLPQRSCEIILYYFRDRLTYSQIGEKYGITRSRVPQIISPALEKLREPVFMDRIMEGPTARYHETVTTAGKEEFLSRHISYLNLSSRAYNSLTYAGIHYIKDLISKSEGDLAKFRNFGSGCVSEVKKALARYNLCLNGYLSKSDRESTLSSSSNPQHIDDLGLCRRARNVLLNANIHTVEELVHYTAEDLQELRNLGPTSIENIQERLGCYGLSLSYHYQVTTFDD